MRDDKFYDKMRIVQTKCDKRNPHAMKLIRTKLNIDNPHGNTLPADTLLFDIETTGLSADTSYLYLIGAVCLENGEATLLQWFCDEYSEEKEVLASFRDFVKGYTRLVHYNGTGFDIPYLNKKFKRHCLSFSIDSEGTLDIYKLLLPFKKHTDFPDFKQKTIEQCAGFIRTDTFSGGDLTEVYAAYAGKYRLAILTGKTEEADALRHVMLLHNHDDLVGLYHLYVKTRLADFFAGSLQPAILKLEQGLLYTFDFPLLPFPISLMQNDCVFTVTEKETDLLLPFYDGELKFFFKDYKNYYYLKYEDTAIHASVAEWVDKEAKEKCKPATAYQKKNGTFLALPFAKPEQAEVLNDTPLFYQVYKQLPAYTEFNAGLVCNPAFVSACFDVFLKKK